MRRHEEHLRGLSHGPYLLRIDESKARNSADIMIMRRIKAAAEGKQSKLYDELLADRDVNQLFNADAIYFPRPAQI